MDIVIADTLEVLRIGFWATFWALFGGCLIALAFAWGEQLSQRAAGGVGSIYSGPNARMGKVLMLLGLLVIACSWIAWAVLGANTRADSLGEKVIKAVTGSDLGHVALLVASVGSVLMFSLGAILFLYSEQRAVHKEPAKVA